MPHRAEDSANRSFTSGRATPTVVATPSTRELAMSDMNDNKRLLKR
jgi:uncharacterized membrane protein YdfJ with MMPL/SSD domain